MSASTNWEDVYRTQTARIAELERENAELREQLNHTVTTKYHDQIVQESVSLRVKETAELKRENASLRAEINALKKDAICRRRGIPDRAESARIQNLTEAGDRLFKENVALQKLIIKAGYIITNFNGEMALCRDPWHQPKEEQP